MDKPAADQDQDHPYQIIDLFPEVGHGLRSLQLRYEDVSQEQNDWYRSQNDSQQLIHGKNLPNSFFGSPMAARLKAAEHPFRVSSRESPRSSLLQRTRMRKLSQPRRLCCNLMGVCFSPCKL
jgi:hypothetical protein